MSLMTQMYQTVVETGYWSDHSFFVQPGGYAITVAELHRDESGAWAVYWFGYATVSKGVRLVAYLEREDAVRFVENLVTFNTVIAP